jgi:tetratricopeptide (TPR) repeat protein
MDLDFQLGGGHTRGMLLYFFQNQVLPLFKSAPVEGSARRELFAATAELTQMLGWSAYDAGRQGAAQRYFVHGLRLAREAEDAQLGARLLSNLSHQANYLGRFTEAVYLARAAQSVAARTPSTTVSAMLLTMEARALASLGDAEGCTAVLTKAERKFERRNPDDDPPWIGYFNEAELAGESAHCFRDLRRSAETDRFCALAIEPHTTPTRTVAFINMVSAMGALNAGNLDQALAVAARSLDLARSLQSCRFERYVTDFVAAVRQRHPRDNRSLEFARLAADQFAAAG